MDEAKSHIVIFPSMGISHLIPFLELAKRFVSQHSNFHVTCIIPTNGPPPQLTKAIVEGLPNSIDVIFLPPVSLEDLPKTTNPGALIFLTMSCSLPSLRNVLKSLLSKTHLAAFLTNFFGVDSFDVAKEFNIPWYIFCPSPATVLSLFMHLPKLHETVSSEIGHLPDPVKIPGCIPIPAKDLPGGFQDLKSESHERFMHIGKRISSAEGIVVNSFKDMESGVIKALQDGAGRNNPPVYPIGPLIQAGSSSEEDRSGCLRWLDNQPRGSVLYVSFGSGGTLSCAQIGELALGLEMSGQKFLWVVRRPSDESESPNAAYLSDKSQFDPAEFLPSGFLERTKGQGLVVTSWAPQTQILSHGSTGGFLSHCGWSSTLESVMFGVPIIAWPLFAEQKTNALILEKEKKVALRPKANENELVEREEIAKVVKDLMEGEEGKRLGQRMRDLKDAAARALSKDGSSTLALSELASKWENVEAPKVE